MYAIYGLVAREYLTHPRDRDACSYDKWTGRVEDAKQFEAIEDVATFLAHHDVPGPVTIHRVVEKPVHKVEYVGEEVE